MLKPPAPTDTYPVYCWWASLSMIAVLNLVLLRWARRELLRREGSYEPWLKSLRRRQFIMSAFYVGGCAFRSVIPCHHTLRRVIVESFLSTVFVGRSVATVAELCAGEQLKMLLFEIGQSTNDVVIVALSQAIVPMLFTAEIFSWYACLTTNYAGSIVEESLWAMSALCSLVSFLRAQSSYVGKEQQDFMFKASTMNMFYFAYMVSVDVPNYIKGHIINTSNGKEYETLSGGLRSLVDISEHEQSLSFGKWRYAMVWMTLYFSVACWASIAVVNSPRMDQGLLCQRKIK